MNTYKNTENDDSREKIDKTKEGYDAISFIDEFFEKCATGGSNINDWNRKIYDRRFIDMRLSVNDLHTDIIHKKWLDISGLHSSKRWEPGFNNVKEYLAWKRIISWESNDWGRWLEVIE